MNLQAQYQQIFEFCSGYCAYLRKINWQLISPWRTLPILLKKDGGKYSSFRAWADNLGKRMVAEALSDEIKKNEFFPVYTSQQSLDGLSTLTLRQFPDFSFKKLQGIAKLGDATRVKIPFFKILGVIVAIGTFLLKTVPTPIIEKQFHIAYDQYQIFVFWMVLAVVIYIGTLFFRGYIDFRRQKKARELAQDVIQYINAAD